MLKKIIIGLVLGIILMQTMQVVFAQRSIDPGLKPQNLPALTETEAITKAQCIELHKNDIFHDPKTDTYKTLSGKDLEDRIWDAKNSICSGDTLADPINAYLQTLGGAILMLSGSVAVIVIAVGGFLYQGSRGNQQQMELAKNTLVYGVIGIMVIIFSYFIVATVIKLVIGGSPV